MNTQIRHRHMQPLIRVFAVCLLNFLLKVRKNEIQPTKPYIRNELIHFIKMGKSTWLKREQSL